MSKSPNLTTLTNHNNTLEKVKKIKDMSLHIHITKLMKKTNLLNQSTMKVLAPNEEPPSLDLSFTDTVTHMMREEDPRFLSAQILNLET